MGAWHVEHCTKRFLVHDQSPRLVVLHVDGQGGWTYEPDVEAELRHNLAHHPSWKAWEDATLARGELESRAHQATQRIATRYAEEFEEWGGTTLTAIAMIAHESRVNVFGAGSYKARILRDGQVIQELGSPLPREVLDFIADRERSSTRKANLFDTVIMEGGFASIHDPRQTLADYGSFEVQEGDTLIIAKRSFFNGYKIVEEPWTHYQDPALDWSEIKTIGSRHQDSPDVFLAHFV